MPFRESTSDYHRSHPFLIVQATSTTPCSGKISLLWPLEVDSSNLALSRKLSTVTLADWILSLKSSTPLLLPSRDPAGDGWDTTQKPKGLRLQPLLTRILS